MLPVSEGSPAQMVRDMLARRHGVTWGIDPVLKAAPLFMDSRNRHLTRDGVLRFIRHTLKAAGWAEARQQLYGTHSCRIGGCTALFQLGATAEVIKNMGGWSSDAYKVYIRMQQAHLMNFSKRMCGGE
jgi:site-specific recombinase XerD